MWHGHLFYYSKTEELIIISHWLWDLSLVTMLFLYVCIYMYVCDYEVKTGFLGIPDITTWEIKGMKSLQWIKTRYLSPSMKY